MERTEKCVKQTNKLEDLDVNSVIELLEKWDQAEFVGFVRDRQIDGRKLVDVTEGIVKLWRPKVNAKKFILFIENLKLNPEKYLKDVTINRRKEMESSSTVVDSIESQYQTVKKVKIESTTNLSNVEELLKKIVPAKSFLYRNHQKKQEKATPSYLPMDSKKPRKFFRLSSYDYPNFDILSIFSKQESVEDRYYSVKTNSRYYIQKTYKKQDSRTKYKSLQTPEELSEKIPEDHFYEDLCYNDVTKDEENKPPNLNQVANVKPCMVKLQELFNTFRMPFFKKHEVLEEEKDRSTEIVEKEKEVNFYENSDGVSNMYDSVHVKPPCGANSTEAKTSTLPVEDYLEPVVVSKEYCDVALRQRDDSLLGYIMSIFDSRFGLRRETSDANQSEDSDCEDKNTAEKIHATENGDGKIRGIDTERKSRHMADRPLPIPVENEPYYMSIDRAEAENLLRGQPDGTFVLRPSSQPNHAYTLTVSCSNAVHNVGVRRRSDGRLALGYARRGERTFSSVPSLLRHHKKRRLLLVTAGGVIGATTLDDAPQYYQTPSSLPLCQTGT